MSYYIPDFEPTEVEAEKLLADAPLSLLMQGIETQFDDPFEHRKRDYVQTFITKYHYCRQYEDEETKDEIDEYLANFLSFFDDLMQRELGVGYPNLNDMNTDDALELIHLSYRFFITNIKKNFANLVTNYFTEHKSDLASDLEDRKDITTLNFKDQIDDQEDILILSNMDKVIREILSTDMDVDEFFKYVDDPDNMELEFVSEQYDLFEITGNFVADYIEMVDEDFRHTLESKLRNHILKKYDNRKKLKKIIKDGEDAEDDLTDDDAED